MDPYTLITLPAPVLRQKAQEVAHVDDAVRAQANRMQDTMYKAEGIGLAANQVGLLNRVIVLDTQYHHSGEKAPIAMINPELVWTSDETWTYKEGCLSIPQSYATVERPRHVRVTYLDLQGHKQELAGSDLLATCLQHEIDHLNGVLFIDHLSRLKRSMIMRKFEKLGRENGAVL